MWIWGRLLTCCFVTSLLLVSGTGIAYAADGVCSAREAAIGECAGAEAGIQNGAVVIRDELTRGEPGTGGRRDSAPPQADGSPTAPPASSAPRAIPRVGCGLNSDRLGCTTAEPVLPPPDADEITAPTPADVVTISDLVNFRPAAATSSMEPNGWMVVGLHTNFFASATAPQVQTGELLGQPATVRFDPTRYVWDYGDGDVTDSGSAGASWQQLGLPEFSPTATSHVYENSGEYTIDVSVHYVAEYQYADSGWRAVEGVLVVPGSPLVATASTAATVLVEQECTTNPSGPGC